MQFFVSFPAANCASDGFYWLNVPVHVAILLLVRTILALMLPLHCSRVNTVVFCLHDQIRDDHLGVWLFTDTSTTKGGGGEEGAKLTC